MYTTPLRESSIPVECIESSFAFPSHPVSLKTELPPMRDAPLVPLLPRSSSLNASITFPRSLDATKAVADSAILLSDSMEVKEALPVVPAAAPIVSPAPPSFFLNFEDGSLPQPLLFLQYLEIAWGLDWDMLECSPCLETERITRYNVFDLPKQVLPEDPPKMKPRHSVQFSDAIYTWKYQPDVMEPFHKTNVSVLMKNPTPPKLFRQLTRREKEPYQPSSLSISTVDPMGKPHGKSWSWKKLASNSPRTMSVTPLEAAKDEPKVAFLRVPVRTKEENVLKLRLSKAMQAMGLGRCLGRDEHPVPSLPVESIQKEHHKEK
jgi:hypothetical protein